MGKPNVTNKNVVEDIRKMGWIMRMEEKKISLGVEFEEIFWDGCLLSNFDHGC